MNREHLLKVMLDQKQEQEQYLQRAIPRLFDKNVEKSQNLLKRGLVTVITGVRRSGKSTYALQLAHAQKNHGSVVAINFDDERLIGFSPNDFDLFLQVAYETVSDPKIFIFDELQNIAGWELFINRLLRKDVLII
ncbi:MAG: AAA family ATPase, partial [Bdellovibrio sp.]|nr:AAA family ATPase [Bdellovibrio sp.]